jgi:hypothetical protein
MRIVPHRFYSSIIDAPALIGNECIYPEALAGPLIRTFSKETMIPFYFKMGSIYLQPKYTSSQDIFGLCIVVSDEVYDTEYADLVIAYNIPTVDILSLKRTHGDFPQDCTIDILLTTYLESSSLVNKGQSFTLSFSGNEYPLKNSITFQVESFTVHERTLMEDMTHALNQELHELGLEECISSSIEEYEKKALELAFDPSNLRSLRERLNVNIRKSAAFDPERYAKNIEDLYTKMYYRYHDGLAPTNLYGISH